MEQWVARMKGRCETRRLEIAALPCATCVSSSAGAAACKYGRADECRHEQERGAWLARERRRTERRRRLDAAGVTAHDNPDVALVIEERLAESTATSRIHAALADRSVRWILIHGPPGRGKTLAAFMALAEKGGLFVLAHDLSLPRPTHRPEGPRRPSGWTEQEAMDARILVVDDLGLERESEFAKTQIESAICGREYGDRTTIMTSNTAPNELATRYGARFASRVGGAKGRVIRCDAGPDLRARKEGSP